MKARSIHTVILNLFWALLLSGLNQGLRSQAGWEAVSAEEVTEKLHAAGNYYEQVPSLSVKVTHASFRNYTSYDPLEKAEGYYHFQGKLSHSFTLGLHEIRNERFRLIVYPDQRLIVLNDPENSQSREFNLRWMDSLIASCTSKSVLRMSDKTEYRLETGNGSKYSAVHYLLSKENRIEKITLFFKNAVSDPQSGNAERSKPRVEISFSDYREKTPFNYAEEFDEKKYITFSGTQPVVQPAYSDYEILDLRIHLKSK